MKDNEKPEMEECPECEGQGYVATTSPSDCNVYRGDCCGSCYGEEDCETCEGTGKVEADEEDLLITDYLDYTISNFGNVWSKKRKKYLKPQKDNKGYLRVTLYNAEGCKTFKIHKLVAIEFLGHVPNGMHEIIDHIDEDKTNNRVSNLQITDNRKNVSKSYKDRSSKYTGVHTNRSGKRWIAQIVHKRKTEHIGTFDTELEASAAYQSRLNEIDKEEE